MQGDLSRLLWRLKREDPCQTRLIGTSNLWIALILFFPVFLGVCDCITAFNSVRKHLLLFQGPVLLGNLGERFDTGDG